MKSIHKEAYTNAGKRVAEIIENTTGEFNNHI
jgi:hypothetical protein